EQAAGQALAIHQHVLFVQVPAARAHDQHCTFFIRTQRVVLNWKATNEQNLAAYIVERSEDGIHFHDIGSRIANNSAGEHVYELDDPAPLPGISYYRLKQTDTDGAFVYSAIVVINRNNASKSISLFPNPAQHIVTVVFSGSNHERKLMITDARGAVIKTIMVKPGVTTIQPDISSFANGIYNIVLTDDKMRLVERLIKQ
ncbi:MAG: T9SS type A sorting domain-containing protein, partial [Sphingobacteriales bacterium]